MKLPLWANSLPAAGLAVVLAVSLTGCNHSNPQNKTQANQTGTPRVLSFDNKQGYHDSETTLKQIPLSLAAKQLGLNMVRRGDEYLIGLSDVLYRVKPGQAHALSMNHPVILSHAPEERNGDLYFTRNAMSDLLGTQVGWNNAKHEIIFAPFPGRLAHDSVVPGQTPRIHIQSNVDVNRLISYAKTFMGTKYDFGAGNYKDTGTFDCSSFTQYVFGRYNVNLPRLAKDQAHTGTPVRKSELEKGDLVFFTVPGRFKNDNIAGHVGIYIGNGQFIHTWGAPGVQITNLDKEHWKDMYLGARRVL
ncbi:C40 family peptidase [Paenibacillus pinistramenti]|uniref:C40 family peptidase n=1 Tax=Paenibacillus pinistramenti TaxID=1768003 RepID=UPI001396B409|nr:C40 family peptidase [Paenibacillus pinistramenti]